MNILPDGAAGATVDTRPTAIGFRVRRTAAASVACAVARSRHAGAAAVDADALRLEHGSRSSTISLGSIESAAIRAGWLWSRIRVRHAAGAACVSGLSRRDAGAFLGALENARAGWWRRTLASRGRLLRSVGDRLAQLTDPPAYQARSVFSALEREAGRAAGQLAGSWPEALSDTPEIRNLRRILDFLEDPDRIRTEANAAFVANELVRSKELFDRAATWPLTGEQRRAIVTDEDRNLIVAAAGSGKTSVIVTKTDWLLRAGRRRPPELLLLAFAREARREMEERIRRRLGADAARDMTVTTFHALGLAILGEVEGRRPAVAKAAGDEAALIALLGEIVAGLQADRQVSAAVLRWFSEQFAPYRSEHEFNNWGEYIDYIRTYEIRSLKGDKVRSFEECEIANFLYLNGINYEYERVYDHDAGSPDKGRYRPDFFLPDAGIWIEHFGINAEGKTAPFVPQQQYLESMAWKRALHVQHGTVLIETFSHECAAGTLLRNLETKLHARGVVPAPIPPAEVFAVLRQQNRIDPLVHLTATFLRHFKGARLSYGDILRRAGEGQARQRAEAFLTLFRPVFERYQETLARAGEIDFHDMIARAAEHVEAGRYDSPFGYILVDEFQDISQDRARLLKALLDRRPGARLFAVGDDWQAIFRFAGSDIGIMRDFEGRFGAGERLPLETTFRSADRIAAVAAGFILRNPAQIPKAVRATRRAGGPRVHVGLRRGPDRPLLNEALDRIRDDGNRPGTPASVLLLGRYNHLRPRHLSGLARQYPGLQLAYRTMHGAKGLEADYAVVLGLHSGKYGFPSEASGDPLLDLVLAAPEAYPDAEERRLFYVALTRARRRVFLLAGDGPPSAFVTELVSGSYDIDVFNRPPADDVPCPACVRGHPMRRRTRQGGRIFYGCSNYPYCEYVQRPCPSCREGLPVREKDGHRCRDCGQSLRSCPACDGWLSERMGRYGRFLGCSNYPACRHTRDVEPRRRRSASGRSPRPGAGRRPGARR